MTNVGRWLGTPRSVPRLPSICPCGGGALSSSEAHPVTQTLHAALGRSTDDLLSSCIGKPTSHCTKSHIASSSTLNSGSPVLVIIPHNQEQAHERNKNIGQPFACDPGARRGGRGDCPALAAWARTWHGGEGRRWDGCAASEYMKRLLVTSPLPQRAVRYKHTQASLGRAFVGLFVFHSLHVNLERLASS